jgi:hypothetical protein
VVDVRTLRNGNVLKEQDDRRHREVTTKSGNQLAVDGRLADVLEATGDVAQDPDRILSLLVRPVPAVQERRDREDDDHEGITEYGDEEEEASY